MAKAGTLPYFCNDNTHSDDHLSLTQTMNESDREEKIEEEVNNENGGDAETEDKVTCLSLSGD